MATWQADTYRLYQYAGRESGTRYVIRLEEAGGTRALHAYFTTTSPLPSNSMTDSFYFLYYPHDMFSPMMEMLREEKPIYIHAYNENNIYVGTHEEPVGEEET